MSAPRFGPAHPRLGRAGYRLVHPALRAWARSRRFYTHDSAYARDLATSLRDKIDRGEPVHLLGLGAGGHDASAALVEVTARTGARLVSSHEEERFTGIRHYAGHPVESLARIRADLDRLGLFAKDLHACVASFDYVQLFSREVQSLLEELPHSHALVHPDVYPDGIAPTWRGIAASEVVREALGFAKPVPVLGMPHHGNHAAFAWLSSPFASLDTPTLVLVVDAQGDDCSVSCYVGRRGSLYELHRNRGLWDSLGHFYGFLSSVYSGLPIGQAEGSWMALAAFGNRDPATNPFHPVLRRLLGHDARGCPSIDRSLTNWQAAGARKPLSDAFAALVERAAGSPMSPGLPEFSYGDTPPALADLAAATQLLFEESLIRIVDYCVGRTGADRLVLTGGTALNCIANLRLVEHFDQTYYERQLGRKDTRLQLWVPPAPADEGTPAGAAMQLAMSAGVHRGESLVHAFYCGNSPADAEILSALRHAGGIEFESLGSCSEDATHALSALLAHMVAEGGVIGLFRGRAEIGRRALGNRSILASPRSTPMRDYVNRMVKRRQPFRPLAPICTTREAQRWFEFAQDPDSPVGSAYSWMGIAVRARPEAHRALPGVVHVDGTARVQIVSESDALLWAFLTRLGRLTGAEVAINTSLNLQSPIVQTPAQAARLLASSPGLDAIVFVSDGDSVHLAWSATRNGQQGRRVRRWISSWRKSSAAPALRATRDHP